MKVLDRIQEIRNLLGDVSIDRTIRVRAIVISAELDQLEVEIVVALQIAREEGYDAGLVQG